MSGQDIFAGMSFVDDRFVDEAEHQTIPKAAFKPWIRAIFLAACVCLILFGVYHLHPFQVSPKGAEGSALDRLSSVEGQGPEMQQAKDHAPAWENAPTGKACSAILRVDTLTEQGFTATVAELVDTNILQIGTEVNVVLGEGVPNLAPNSASAIEDRKANPVGTYVIAEFMEYDEETNTIVVSALERTVPPTEKP